MQPLSLKKYPSTAALQCFESAARHLSFTKAAKELHMTQSAVSKQVAQLESVLNTELFHRSRQRLHLTPAGIMFRQEAESILSKLELSLLNILAHGANTHVLRIACHPTLCARWFIPLVKGFGKKHPNIHLDVSDQISVAPENSDTLDIAFLYGDGVWPNMECEKLFDEHCIPVCSPELLNSPPNNAQELTRHVLIQFRSRPGAWTDYFNYISASSGQTFAGPRFDTYYACIRAAEEGCGIALVPQFLVQRELDRGRLITAWPQSMPTRGAYYMIYPQSLAADPKVLAMREWVHDHLAEEKIGYR